MPFRESDPSSFSVFVDDGGSEWNRTPMKAERHGRKWITASAATSRKSDDVELSATCQALLRLEETARTKS